MLRSKWFPSRNRQLSGLSVLLALVLALSIFMATEFGNALAADETYTVHSGDNLTAIAARYGLSVEALAKTNGIANVNNIYAGQVLKLPKGSGVSGDAAAGAVTSNLEAYLVQPGDTLSGLASKFGVSQVELASVNHLSVMSYLYVGQTLRIPGHTAAPVSPVATPTPAPKTPAATTAAIPTVQGNSYIVQPGDNLSSIAARYNTTVEAITNLNKLANPDSLYVGQILLVPGNGVTVPPATTVAAVVTSGPPVLLTGTDAAINGGKWIDVNLSQQRLTAYEGKTAIFNSLVSTGISIHPTVTGTFNIYTKYGSQAMSGPGYYLPGVPYVMYFYQAYAIHGTYWHHNFGHPMSHGCVNLPTDAAKFMYSWAPIGTPVVVHF